MGARVWARGPGEGAAFDGVAASGSPGIQRVLRHRAHAPYY